MPIFDPHASLHGDPGFDRMLSRLKALVADMEMVRDGASLHSLGVEAPVLEDWALAQRRAPCLTGLSSGHPILTGEGRPIVTSELWLLSSDRKWARTLSRWYKLGRPFAGGRRHG